MNNIRPVYSGTRNFLGLQDLVISLFTQKCQFKCAYCTIPSRSSDQDVKASEVIRQLDWIWNKYGDKLPTLQQLSVGNEGSILDDQRFPSEVMEYLLKLVNASSNVKVLSLETRPEYVREDYLRYILSCLSKKIALDVTIGWETQDDYLRQTVLNKRVSKSFFEKKLALLGKLGIRLTSYVLVKPGPAMTDEDGVLEAIATVQYLASKCQHYGVDLIIYLNPTYIAKGSALEKKIEAAGYQPPRIQDIYRIIQATQAMGIPIYTGLWSEGLSDEANDYTARQDYDPLLRQQIYQLNHQPARSGKVVLTR